MAHGAGTHETPDGQATDLEQLTAAMSGPAQDEIEDVLQRLLAARRPLADLFDQAPPPSRRRPRRAEVVTYRVRIDLKGTRPPLWRRLEPVRLAAGPRWRRRNQADRSRGVFGELARQPLGGGLGATTIGRSATGTSSSRSIASASGDPCSSSHLDASRLRARTSSSRRVPASNRDPKVGLFSRLSRAEVQRNARKAARTSSTNAAGCSNAAKWPPLAGSFQ